MNDLEYTKYFTIEDREYKAVRNLPKCSWGIFKKDTKRQVNHYEGNYVSTVKCNQNDSEAIKQLFLDEIESNEKE